MRLISNYSFLLFIPSFLLFSCSSEKKTDNPEWLKERDSLQLVNYQKQMLLDDMTATMADISLSLDTIAMHESMIIKRVDENGNPLSKKNLKIKLNTLSEVIRQQREKMEALEKSMADGKSSITQLKTIIAYLNTSLEQKELEIQRLKAELDIKNINIAQLNSRVSNLKDTVASVRQENIEQREQLKTQNEIHEASLHEVYYVIGTKDQLLKWGVLSKGGFLRKNYINYASMDKTFLTKADKRTLKTINIEGKSPTILSNEPKGSYTLEKGKTSSILTINDSDQFWNTNNRVLVIQIKE